MSVPVAAGVILGAMVVLVLVTMLVEQRGRVVQRVRTAHPSNLSPEMIRTLPVTLDASLDGAGAGADEVVARTGAEPADTEPTTTPEPVPEPAEQEPEPVLEPAASEPVPEPAEQEPEPVLEPAASEPVPEPAEQEPEPTIPPRKSATPVAPAARPDTGTPTEVADQPGPRVGARPAAATAGRSEGALTIGSSSVSVRDRATVDTLTGVLLGAYVASGGSAAKRAAAWVTVRSTPPSLPSADFSPGVDLRGKVGRVGTLLRCDDGGATWITLQADVDIERGLRRSPVDDPVLQGLLVWWQATRTVPTVLSTDEANQLASAIATVEDALDGHPWSEPVARIRSALLDGVVHDREVLLGVAIVDNDAPNGAAPEPERLSGRPASRPATQRS